MIKSILMWISLSTECATVVAGGKVSFYGNGGEVRGGGAGVDYPVASVVLHFCVATDYPILDVRALWSLHITKPAVYGFRFWWDYVRICRQEAACHGMTVREFDKALWQYSKENQP